VVVGEAFIQLVRHFTPGAGCLVVLEDLHWADPETLTIVEYLADNLAAEPICLLVTARREGDTAAILTRLAQRHAMGLLTLGRLDRDAVHQMARACCGGAEPTPELLATVDSYADGVPFLVEELIAGTSAAAPGRAADVRGIGRDADAKPGFQCTAGSGRRSGARPHV
jgi:predicted ATPase